MKAIAVIPARLKSERLKNKVLKPILGKPLLWYTWQQAKKASVFDKVIIACCDNEVKDAAENFGADVFLTSISHQSGTDRVAEVASKIDCDVALNIQADEPFIRPETLNELARFLFDNPDQLMASVAFSAVGAEYPGSPNVVKVVVDGTGNALYFSRALIPYPSGISQDKITYLKHIGIYAYRKDFLLEFTKMRQSCLEKIEKLEQLRAVENGVKIKILKVDYDTIGVDTEEDFLKVQRELENAGKNSRHV